MKNEEKRKYKTKKKRKVLKSLFFTLISILAVFTLAFGGIYLKIRNSIDFEEDERLFLLSKGSRTTKIYYNARAEKETLEQINIGREVYYPKELVEERVNGSEKGIWCKYEIIPDNLKNAFIAIEDHRFFEHDGVDWLRTAKATANYFADFDSRFGGSTITQQLIKNISADDDVTVERKLREILRALNIEKRFSKEEILELYLNIVPMSEGCVGVGAAAEIYFGKSVSDLTLAECACLAAITNSPTYFNPLKNPENNAERRDLILCEMKKYNFINESQLHSAQKEILSFAEQKDSKSTVHSWYTEAVLNDVIEDLMQYKGMNYESAFKTVYSGGLKIYTLMDIQVQNTLEKYFENFSNFPWECSHLGMQMAMTVVDSKNGNLLGIVGSTGKKEADRTLSYADQAKLPPGSSIKPLSVYAPALEEGLISWSTVVDDTPVSFYNNTPWPSNYPSIYGGLTDIPTALAYSKNTVAVKLFSALGAERSYNYLVNKLGIRSIVRSATENGNKFTDLAPAPLALGQLSYGSTLREMTSAYSSFYDGNYRGGRSYLVVYDSLGNIILENPIKENYVWSAQNACIMTQLLKNVVEYGTAKDITLKQYIDTAGKTGTSSEDRDRWFIGYTPHYTAGIWCGYPNREREVGDIKKTHLEVWDDVMKRLHTDLMKRDDYKWESFSIAPGVVRCSYCKDSGCLFSTNCACDPRENRMSVGYFTQQTIPRQICSSHILVDYDIKEKGIVDLEKDKKYYSKKKNKDNLKKVALVKELKRDFPVQIYITDAEYIYRPVDSKDFSPRHDAPFYANTIRKGRYIGLSYHKDGKQFNSFCFEHKREATEDYEDVMPNDELQNDDELTEEKENPEPELNEQLFDEKSLEGIFIEE